ncbi:MAG: diacylglycerol/lipid kinase family protein [Candidatus Levyibacteriota bacterium]
MSTIKKPTNSIKFIFNPHAGEKRKTIGAGNSVSLDEIKALLHQYQLPVDYAPTKGPKHATQLARESTKEGYETVIVAGGDGTVSEAANGLVGSNTNLGIIPMGTFMNIARMLSIPLDIEKAVEIIKIKRVRKIDIGKVTKMEGEKSTEPYYFIESSGIGLDAHIQDYFKQIEQGRLHNIFPLINKFFHFSSGITEIITDTKTISCKASIINIANGPYAGANLKMAPSAKLNDHRLTVSIYPMTQWELIKYFTKMKLTQKSDGRKLHIIKTKNVKLRTSTPDMYVHVDASLFGSPPVHYQIIPNALNVICGFPGGVEPNSLHSRTTLDP